MKSAMVVAVTTLVILSFFLSMWVWCYGEPFIDGLIGVGCNVFLTLWAAVAGIWIGGSDRRHLPARTYVRQYRA